MDKNDRKEYVDRETKLWLCASLVLGVVDWFYFYQNNDSLWSVIVNSFESIWAVPLAIIAYFLVANTFLFAPLSLLAFLVLGIQSIGKLRG